jgi:predicted ATPase
MNRESSKLLHLFICPTFIGREPNLANLQMSINNKRTGEGQPVLLISGEAGIGKSRLIAEAKTFALRQGFLLLEGQCFQSDSTVPYAPLLDLFLSYFAHHNSSTLPGNLHSFVVTLARLLPDLALLFPDLPATLDLAPPSASPEEEQRRLFAAMSLFLIGQTTQQPLLIIMEDVHWSDDLSREFLLHLVRRCRELPLYCCLLIARKHSN